EPPASQTPIAPNDAPPQLAVHLPTTPHRYFGAGYIAKATLHTTCNSRQLN
ncbi:hypothetical protein KI387_008002, partial [Taxus chinensis]